MYATEVQRDAVYAVQSFHATYNRHKTQPREHHLMQAAFMEVIDLLYEDELPKT